MKNYLRRLDWPLLIFLVLLMNVKLYIKVVAILFALIMFRKRAFTFNRLAPEQRFYAAMILLALLNILLSVSALSMNALLACGLGCFYWLMAMSAAWFLRLFVKEGDNEKIHRTISLFFLLNSFVMLVVFAGICIRTGSINPYTYEGEHRKYFISTGDHITGIGFDGSVTTAMICAFGLLYFFYRKEKLYSYLCLVTLLMTTSNFTALLLIGVLFFTFFFHTDRVQKVMIGLYLLTIALFALKVSPENNRYAVKLIEQASGKEPYIPSIPLPRPRMNDFVEGETTLIKKEQDSNLLAVLYTPGKRDSLTGRYNAWDFSGRWIAWQQLKDFFVKKPAKLLLGTGMGNFSSRLAFKTAGLGIEGGYPKNVQYISPFFLDNYLFLYLFYHTREEGAHSVINKPDSVYGQLLAEYGLAGILCFVLWYVLPFLRLAPGSSYGLPLLLLLGGAFFTEYWFEQLSIVFIFELLILLDTHGS